MNERIKELAEQAGLPFTKPTGMISGLSRKSQEQSYQKFAELIVKEAGAYLMQPEFIGRSDLDWSMVLNEHFGVEE